MTLYSFLNDVDAQSDFDQNVVRENLVPWNHSYLEYALTDYFFDPFAPLKSLQFKVNASIDVCFAFIHYSKYLYNLYQIGLV